MLKRYNNKKVKLKAKENDKHWPTLKKMYEVRQNKKKRSIKRKSCRKHKNLLKQNLDPLFCKNKHAELLSMYQSHWDYVNNNPSLYYTSELVYEIEDLEKTLPIDWKIETVFYTNCHIFSQSQWANVYYKFGFNNSPSDIKAYLWDHRLDI